MASNSTLMSPNGNNSNTETYTRVLPLSVRTASEPSQQHFSSNSSSSSGINFGKPNTSSKSSHCPASTTITNVRVTLTYPTSTSITSSSNRQIRLCLTNDSDPLFYFFLLITEQDYPALKQNQGLLVDFINFPSQLISLLDKCCNDKFILVLKYSPIGTGHGGSVNSNNTILDIVESNPFKYLSHLSLNIIPGSDSEVKKYLSEVTLQLKEENETLRTKFQHLHSSLESELSKGKYELERKNEEIMQLREEMYKESTQSLEKYMRELGQEKDKFSHFQNDLARKVSLEKNEMEQKYREIVSTLESKNSAYETEKYKLQQNLQSTEGKLKETESKLKSAEGDLRLLNHELQSLRKNNSKLDADYHEKQRVVADLVNKRNSLESELKEKTDLITRHQELIGSLGDKCRNYEERHSEIHRQAESSKSQLRSATSDLTKANEIIRKMQDDGRHLGKQLKTQAKLVQDKDAELNDKCRYLEETCKKLDDLTAKFEANEKELKENRAELEQLKKTIETQEESLNSKEKMITWLNKQLNQNQGLTTLSHFRQALAAQTSALNESVPGPLSARLKSQSLNPSFQDSINNVNNNANSSVPSWMNLYSNNTGRSINDGGLFGDSNPYPIASSTADTTANNNNNNTSEKINRVDNEPVPKSSIKSTSGKKISTSRPATWAKPNKKVTMELGAGSQPSWRH